MAREVRTGRKTGDGVARDGGAPPFGERTRERRARVPAVGPARTPAGAQRERRGGFRRFAAESYGELRKVDWPTQRQLVSAVLAVIVACVVVGVFLYVADEAFSRLVRDVLLSG